MGQNPTQKKIRNVTILGAGRWGTAIAIFLGRQGMSVTLQCFSEKTYQHILEQKESPRLPGYPLGEKIRPEKDLNKPLQKAELVVISTPVPFLRGTLEKIESLPKEAILVGINKGIERETLLTPPEIVEEYFPQNPLAQLSGPCFPSGLLSETTPVAETIASKNETLAQFLQEVFSAPGFRVYRSTDIKGVALLGAIKNVFAIAAGIQDGMQMKEEALSVLITRGLAEMRRICQVFQISQETLYGLSGLGDLALTCYSSSNSHNKNFGRRIGQGESIKQILESMKGAIAEGYYTTQAVWELGQKNNLELPLIEMIYKVLYQEWPVKKALLELMNRPLKEED